MADLRKFISTKKLTQAKAAELFGVSHASPTSLEASGRSSVWRCSLLLQQRPACALTLKGPHRHDLTCRLRPAPYGAGLKSSFLCSFQLEDVEGFAFLKLRIRRRCSQLRRFHTHVRCRHINPGLLYDIQYIEGIYLGDVAMTQKYTYGILRDWTNFKIPPSPLIKVSLLSAHAHRAVIRCANFLSNSRDDSYTISVP